MTTLEQAARQALEALQYTTIGTFSGGNDNTKKAIASLSQALNQVKQTPEACNHGWFRTGAMAPGEARCIKCGEWKEVESTKREWVGLNPNERWDLWNNSDQNNSFSFAIAVEAKLRELNT